jgi:serine/threonine protein kinase
MDKTTAAARLGLSSPADPVSITRAYGERLGKLQQRLVAANTDQERHDSQAQLAELVEAYEYLSQTGRYARARPDEDVTQARPVGEATSGSNSRENFIRLEPGAVLSDRLEIGPMLGQGGMGNVFAARDRLKNENVAIKVLREDLMFSAAAKERFLAEAKVSCNFSHPNIVNVYDVGVSGGNYYFSMELLKGQTLRALMEKHHRDRRLFTMAEINEVTRQLVDALRYAHRFIVHRDIKPENIWLEHDGTVKLMDFGIAHANSNSDMTQTGMTLGTAYYMAPEQRTAAKEVDWRADQYSLGIVLYELLSGSVPMGATRPLEQLRRDVPRRYARAVMRAIATHPEDRWISLQAFFSELHLQQRKTPWAAAAVAFGVVAAVAAGTGFYVYKNRNSEQGTAQTSGQSSEPSSMMGPEKPVTQGPEKPTAENPAPGGASGTLTATTEKPPEKPNEQGAANGPLVAGGEVESKPPLSNKPPKMPPADPVINTPSPRGPTPEQLAAIANASQQHDQCVAQCARDDNECKSINRRARADCARTAAFGSGAGVSNNSDCGFYGPERCQYATNRDACLRGMVNKRSDCLQGSGAMIRQRQDCDRAARDADQRCISLKQDCTALCQ